MPTITEKDEARIAAHRAQNAQNREIPFLINTEDARLIPNTERTRKVKDYIPYAGSVSDDLKTRQDFLRYGRRRHVVNSTAERDVFDVGTADVDTLVAFAFDEYGAVLQPTTGIKTLRKQVMTLANAANQPGTSVAPPKPAGLGAAFSAPVGDELSG
jgi:hypothetical protein